LSLAAARPAVAGRSARGLGRERRGPACQIVVSGNASRKKNKQRGTMIGGNDAATAAPRSLAVTDA